MFVAAFLSAQNVLEGGSSEQFAQERDKCEALIVVSAIRFTTKL